MKAWRIYEAMCRADGTCRNCPRYDETCSRCEVDCEVRFDGGAAPCLPKCADALRKARADFEALPALPLKMTEEQAEHVKRRGLLAVVRWDEKLQCLVAMQGMVPFDWYMDAKKRAL